MRHFANGFKRGRTPDRKGGPAFDGTKRPPISSLFDRYLASSCGLRTGVLAAGRISFMSSPTREDLQVSGQLAKALIVLMSAERE
jgi:hypothetical protein